MVSSPQRIKPKKARQLAAQYKWLLKSRGLALMISELLCSQLQAKVAGSHLNRRTGNDASQIDSICV